MNAESRLHFKSGQRDLNSPMDTALNEYASNYSNRIARRSDKTEVIAAIWKQGEPRCPARDRTRSLKFVF